MKLYTLWITQICHYIIHQGIDYLKIIYSQNIISTIHYNDLYDGLQEYTWLILYGIHLSSIMHSIFIFK